MKNFGKKIISLFLIIVFMLSLNFDVIASSKNNFNDVKTALNSSLKYLITKSKTKGIQDWDAIALAMAGYKLDNMKFNGKRYIDFKNDDILKELSYNWTTSYAKHILTISASGYDPRNFNGIDLIEILKSSQLSNGKFKDMINGTNESFLNGHIWSIIALETINENYDKSSAISFLEKNQNNDGGFPLIISGKSDIDITAMAVTALTMAGRNKNSSSVSKALHYLKNNLKKLSKEQQTAETLAWILQAAVSAGDDLSKYVINNRNIINELLLYKDKTGGFRHIKSGKVDDIATNQVVRSLLSYVNKKNAYKSITCIRGNYYKAINRAEDLKYSILYSSYFKDVKQIDFIIKSDFYDEANILINGEKNIFIAKSNNGLIKFTKNIDLKNFNYRLILKKNGKVLKILFGNLEPVEKSYIVKVRVEAPDKTIVDADVRTGNKIVYDLQGKSYVTGKPSAYSALVRALIENNINFNANYDYGAPFIDEIAGIRNRSFGGWDGWMYMVNYTEPNSGMADYAIENNDKILVYYGDWGIKPLTIEILGEVKLNSEIQVRVTSEGSAVKDAIVYFGENRINTNEEGIATILLDKTGTYKVYAEKNTDGKPAYIRSESKYIEIK
ncbi:MAG: DUF4430 domain-containing protein [Caloramator sp.]|nr:DUF4430 domain-containing protein [Caloramator sp.]